MVQTYQVSMRLQLTAFPKETPICLRVTADSDTDMLPWMLLCAFCPKTGVFWMKLGTSGGSSFAEILRLMARVVLRTTLWLQEQRCCIRRVKSLPKSTSQSLVARRSPIMLATSTQYPSSNSRSIRHAKSTFDRLLSRRSAQSAKNYISDPRSMHRNFSDRETQTICFRHRSSSITRQTSNMQSSRQRTKSSWRSETCGSPQQTKTKCSAKLWKASRMDQMTEPALPYSTHWMQAYTPFAILRRGKGCLVRIQLLMVMYSQGGGGEAMREMGKQMFLMALSPKGPTNTAKTIPSSRQERCFYTSSCNCCLALNYSRLMFLLESLTKARSSRKVRRLRFRVGR